MVTKIVMPPLGETMDEGRIIKWKVKVGDPVKKGDPILEIETDKVVLDVESFGSGVLRKIFVNEDETVPIGTVLGIIAEADEDILSVE